MHYCMTYACLSRPGIIERLQVTQRITRVEDLYHFCLWIDPGELVADASGNVHFAIIASADDTCARCSTLHVAR